MIEIIFKILNRIIYITLESKNGSYSFRKRGFLK